MYTHLTIGTNDVEKAKKFYDATFAALGAAAGTPMGEGARCMYSYRDGILIVTKPINGEPASFGNGTTIGIGCDTPEHLQAWHAAGVANGGTTCESPPGLREGMGGAHLAYLRDPDGNKLCLVYRPA